MRETCSIILIGEIPAVEMTDRFNSAGTSHCPNARLCHALSLDLINRLRK